ncbi:MAG: hypothetical protein AABY55_07565 [Candidatus Omnitrophota bacterium]
MLKGLDNKKKIELTITGIGIIILVFLVIGQVSNRRERSRPFPADKPYPALVGNGFKPFPTEVGAVGDVKWGRDPFLLDAPDIKERGMEDMELNGIVSDRQSPYAIINNNVVKLGDKVNGMTVIEINEKNVVLDENGQRHTLELNLY